MNATRRGEDQRGTVTCRRRLPSTSHAPSPRRSSVVDAFGGAGSASSSSVRLRVSESGVSATG